MITDASREELQKVVRCLEYMCRHYTRYVSELASIGGASYSLPDGVRGFGFIASSYYDELLYEFIQLYVSIRSERGPGCGSLKFLDIGCGIGNIVILAGVVGFSAAGLEYDRNTYEVAKQICKYNVQVFRGDMRKFRHYEDYDVLYYYSPMVDSKEMEKFSRKLAKEMKPGAYVIARGDITGYVKSKEFELVDSTNRAIWRKKEK